MEACRILAINPGSTSTKVAVFEDSHLIVEKTLRHSPDDLAVYPDIASQYAFRKEMVMKFLDANHLNPCDFTWVVGRGGLMRPLAGGVYKVNERMLEDLRSARFGKHASNLGAIIAHEIAIACCATAVIVNPVVVDEYSELARFSGHPRMQRVSAFHALNQKAVAHRAASDLGKSYDAMRMVVVHLGGGISVAAHQNGRVVDVNNGLEEGPFSPERAGGVPSLKLLDLCFSGKYTRHQVEKMLVGEGGLVAYLGTSDIQEIHERIDAGERHAGVVLESMAYQVAKEIGAMAVVLQGHVDIIVLTGGAAHSTRLTQWISERVRWIAPVKIYAGEDEMLAMAQGALMVRDGQAELQEY